jgi:hypothetical protein
MNKYLTEQDIEAALKQLFNKYPVKNEYRGVYDCSGKILFMSLEENPLRINTLIEKSILAGVSTANIDINFTVKVLNQDSNYNVSKVLVIDPFHELTSLSRDLELRGHFVEFVKDEVLLDLFLLEEKIKKTSYDFIVLNTNFNPIFLNLLKRLAPDAIFYAVGDLQNVTKMPGIRIFNFNINSCVCFNAVSLTISSFLVFLN